MRKLILFFVLLGFIIEGCATTPASSGNLGKAQYRTLVILGEHIDTNLVTQYAKKYNAPVYFTPGRGFIANSVSDSLRGTLGPSSAMKGLINDLKSINNTEGEWKLIIPSIAERYFLVTLKNMDDGALSNAKGTVYLIESSMNEAIETEIKRVSSGAFSVKYNW